MAVSSDVPQRLLTVNELADYLGISRPMVYSLVNEAQITAVKVGERIRFRPSDIEAYLERQEMTA